MSEALVLGPGEGLTLAAAPEVSFTLKTGTDETNGVWTLFEYIVSPPPADMRPLLALMARQDTFPPAGTS